MTYKLEPVLGKIESPVVLLFPDGKRLNFADGPAVTDATFDHRYVVEAIRAAGTHIEVSLSLQGTPVINWIGEEPVCFF